MIILKGLFGKSMDNEKHDLDNKVNNNVYSRINNVFQSIE